MAALGEYGYYPKAHIFLSHALCINNSMQQRKASSFGLSLREFGHHMTSPMFMCFVLFLIWNNTLMMCDNGFRLYWVDMTFHMSFSMLLLLHDSRDDVKRKQQILLSWLLLGDFGPTYSPTFHDSVGGWKQEALL